MKVVHVVSKDTGGAARAAIRINCALRKLGIDSEIIVLKKTLEEDYIHGMFKSNLTWNIFRLIRKINDMSAKKYKLQGKFYKGKLGLDLSKLKLIKEADIINLHWVNDGMLTLKGIEKLAAKGKKSFGQCMICFPLLPDVTMMRGAETIRQDVKGVLWQMGITRRRCSSGSSL